MEELHKIIDYISNFREIFEYRLFAIGGTPITLIVILNLVLVILISFIVSKYFRKFFQHRVMVHLKLNEGAQFVLLRLIHYLLIVIGILIALNVSGIQLTSLTVIFGLMGFGIAFGLQNITSNFISGIILLFERPVNVGDFVDVDGTRGRVQAINIRATTVITLNNITLIVPNSKFIEGTVTNWSVGDPKVRIEVPVGVAYGSDTKLVTELLLKAAKAHDEVLSDPEADVLFSEFGDSSLNFILRIWILKPIRMITITSDLNYAIDAAFRENGVTIPFPQRDVHFFPEPESAGKTK